MNKRSNIEKIYLKITAKITDLETKDLDDTVTDVAINGSCRKNLLSHRLILRVGEIISGRLCFAPFRWVYYTLQKRWYQLPGMKRMKRFVLAHSTEKDPIWKSSDNLLAKTTMNEKPPEASTSAGDVVDVGVEDDAEDTGLTMT